MSKMVDTGKVLKVATIQRQHVQAQHAVEESDGRSMCGRDFTLSIVQLTRIRPCTEFHKRVHWQHVPQMEMQVTD